ncbi:MAG: HipA domain-containing protein [Beijerinckiaceae bacterium]
MARIDVLSIWLEAHDAPVGQLERRADGGIRFGYHPEHLDDPVATALSLSLPLREEPFGDVEARAWFDNLLQENSSALAGVMAREGLAREDVVGLLSVLGADCAGAVSCLPLDAPPVKRPGDLENDYNSLDDNVLSAIMRSLADSGRLPMESPDPSPVAGVQPKISLVLLPDGRFALPKPGRHVPTTHILKVPRSRDAPDVRLEGLCLGLAARIGLAVAEARAMRVDGVDALLSTRFDRRFESGFVFRQHQEDFAQALGLPAALKYERRGLEHRRFDASGIARLLNRTTTPVDARERFLDLTLFNLMIGNVDNHAKNHALLHNARAVTLAPAYDLLPTSLTAGLTDEFAFRLGVAVKLETLVGRDLKLFVNALGFAGRGAERALEASSRRVLAPLGPVLDDIQRIGSKQLADHISYATRKLETQMGWSWLKTPVRDAFVLRGGGWLQS